MSEAEHLAAVLAPLSKLIKPLSHEDLKSVTAGETKVTLLRTGQVIIEKSKALDAALKFLGSISAEEIAMLEAKQVRLELAQGRQSGCRVGHSRPGQPDSEDGYRRRDRPRA